MSETKSPDLSQGGKRAGMPADDRGGRTREIDLSSTPFELREPDTVFEGPEGPEHGSPRKPAPPENTPGTGQDPEANPSENTQSTEDSLLGRSTKRGLATLQRHLKTMPLKPGVYRMLDGKGDPLYVGKAKSLKKRVVSYTRLENLPVRLQRMVSETVDMEIVVTHTEVEALLLEANMIKRFMPRFNVLLRDDKSFPYILLRDDHTYPQITKHRGQQGKQGNYFGPFPSAGAVNRTLTALEKAFLLRSCSDHMFESRKRPCLLYQIKRCSAPCTGEISEADYAALVAETRAFLFGQTNRVQSEMAEKMQQASCELKFEIAARYRDRIRALTAIQTRQDVNLEGEIEEADVIAAHRAGGQTCIQVFFYRGGRNYGNRPYFPTHDRKMDLSAVMTSFVSQFYQDKPAPKTILLNVEPDEAELLGEALSLHAGRKISILTPKRGVKRKVVDSAARNAEEAMQRRLSESATQKKLLAGLATVLGHPGGIQRVEVYDNSHLQGTDAYGCMIVAGPEGLQKSAYRKWSIKGKAAQSRAYGGDDYGMMSEVLSRRFKRAISGHGKIGHDPNRPDVVLLDGGKGQLSVVQQVFDDLGVTGVTLCAIAKGSDRNAGRETFFMTGKAPFKLEHNDPVLHFLQRLRDEAHRFAIGTHRAKRSKKLVKSLIDEIPDIGPKRKKALLMHFGSARSVARAGLEDLKSVDGISGLVAQKIYDHFHDR